MSSSKEEIRGSIDRVLAAKARVTLFPSGALLTTNPRLGRVMEPLASLFALDLKATLL
jgi:hypothetical protein